MDLRLGAPEHPHYVVENFRVDVLEEVRVESAKLVEGVELVDHAGGVGAHDHVELLDVLDVEVFPELVCGLRPVVLRLEDLDELLRERAVEVHVAEHVPGIGSADGNLHNAPVGTRGHAPFLRGPLGVLCGIVGLEYIRLEGVLREVVVA